MANPINEKLFTLIEQNEGFKNKPYKCPANKLTLGYGFNIEETELPRPVADFWLKYLLENTYLPVLKRIFPKFDSFTMSQQQALIDMVYNMGESVFRQFKGMIAAINANDWQKAKFAALDSNWAKQVKMRAIRVTNMFLV